MCKKYTKIFGRVKNTLYLCGVKITHHGIMNLFNAQKPYQYDYPHPAVTADSVVFGFDGRTLHVLLIERGVQPFLGMWALPGGFMRIDETIEECARRELREEAGIKEVYLEQFHVFSSVRRDPRERVVTVAFFAMVRKSDFELIAGDDAKDALWFEIDSLPPLAFDHAEIIEKARAHIREVLKSRPIIFKLLDKKFTIPELQRLYEIINGTTYDRRNFHKKMASTGYLVETETPTRASSGNPSQIKRLTRVFSFDEDSFEEEQSESSRNPFLI